MFELVLEDKVAVASRHGLVLVLNGQNAFNLIVK